MVGFPLIELAKKLANILENKKMKYSLVVLEVSLSLMDNEFVTLVFCDKKVKLFKIFSVIWEGD